MSPDPKGSERMEKTPSNRARPGHGSGTLSALGFFPGVIWCSRTSDAGGCAQRLLPQGGAAMELRLAEHARTTKDLDVGIEGSRSIYVDFGHYEGRRALAFFGQSPLISEGEFALAVSVSLFLPFFC